MLSLGSTQDTGDRTHLHYAASRGQLITLYSLIQEGQNVNIRICNGITALHDASWTGHALSAKHLIKAGAKLNVLDVAGQSLLFYASAHGQSACVKLLLDSGANPDLQDQRIPPLHAAAYEGATDCVTHLITSGADIEAKDSRKHDTPLLTVSKQGKVQTVAALLQADNPRTLASICRLGLRQHLGPTKLNYIPDLPLPDLMKRYLRCDDVTTDHHMTAEKETQNQK